MILKRSASKEKQNASKILKKQITETALSYHDCIFQIFVAIISIAKKLHNVSKKNVPT